MSDKQISSQIQNEATEKQTEKPKSSTNRLKGSERQKMLINYIKDGTVPEGFYVITTKKGTIQFRKVKETDPEKLIKKYEDKIKKLKEQPKTSEPDTESSESSPKPENN